METLLEHAQRKEDSFKKQTQRTVFHFASPCGWINDPNGFSSFKGVYHLFAQYYPYATHWGPMHWCHATTKDFVMWNREPVALAPDMPFDAEGCFSGTAIEVDGKHILAYTGCRKETNVVNGVAKDRVIQNQCIAIGDGKTYTKLKCNPVITAKDIPFEYDVENFRDPKIWYKDGFYFLAAVIKEKDESGAIVVFRSNNLEQWTFVSKLDSSHGTLGKMWECPDVFTLDGKQVIIISPQEVKGDSNNQLHDGNNSVYLTGEIDKEKFVFTRDRRPENDETVALLDYGIDFYAPETITTVDGRQVLIAWMNNWTSCNVPKGYEWSGQMTFPRELFFKKNWLYQKPVRELEKYRCNGRKNNNIVFVGKKYFDGVTGRHVEILLKIRNNSTEPNEESCRKDINEKKAHTLFTMNVAESKASRVTLCYDFILKELSFDRSQSGYGGDTLFVEKNHPIEKATMHVIPDEDTEISLHCLLDTCSLEVFVDGGKYSFANAFYALPDATDISFEANKEVSVDYEFYKIKV